jgi:HEAT repeat protein
MKRYLLIFILFSGILFSDISKDLKLCIENLNSKDPLKKVYGAYKIGKLNEDISASIPYLINILEDERVIIDKNIGKTSPSNEAKKVLIKIGSSALPYIFEKFNDENTSKLLKLKLIEICGEIKDENSFIFLEKIINDPDIEIKEKVIEILSKNKEEVDFLIDYAKNWDHYLKLKLITGFGKNRIKEAIPFLYECLKDKNWEIRKYAVWAVGEIKDVDINFLIPLVKDKSYLVRKEVAEAFGKIKNPVAVSYLIELLDDSEWLVRSASVKALKEINDLRAVEPVINSLYDKQIEVRIEAIKTLASFKDRRAVIPLIMNLNDRYHLLIREFSSYALGEIKDKRAVYSLINLLNSQNFELRKVSLESLKKITEVDFGYDKKKWKEWAEKNRITSISEN